MQIFNLTHQIGEDSLLFDGDNTFQQSICTSNYGTHTCRVSAYHMTCSSHAGTHADMPSHFIDVPLKSYQQSQYTWPAYMIDLSHIKWVVSKQDFLQTMQFCNIEKKICIFKLYQWWTKMEYATLSSDLIWYLWSLQCPMIGVNTISVDQYDTKDIWNANHGLLYHHNIAIVENLNLSDITHASLEWYCYTTFDESKKAIDARSIASILYIISP